MSLPADRFQTLLFSSVQDITADLESQSGEKGGGIPANLTVNQSKEKNALSKSTDIMSVCIETSTVLSQPVASPLSTSTKLPEVVVSSVVTPSLSVASSTHSEIIPDQPLTGKSIAKLVVTTQHGPTSSNQVLQKVVNSPLITVLNSTGPLTVVKSLCVTSVVSSAPHYTLVNSAPLNVTNTLGKAPTITVLNCGTLTSPVTVVKTISTQQAVEKSITDLPPTVASNLQCTSLAPAVIENRGHNVFVKNTCPDSTSPDNIPQGHKLLTATNFSPSNVLGNISSAGKSSTANGQRNKLKILSNVQIPGSSQQNVMVNKASNLPLPRYNVTARQKLIGVNSAPAKYIGKPPSNVTINSTLKTLQDKPNKFLHSSMQKGQLKTLPPHNYMSKPQQGIKTLSPQHKNVPGQVQRTGSGLRTIPPQRPQKVATKPNYIGKHAVQAQKIKQSTHGKLKAIKPPPGNIYGYHPPPIPDKQLTFNQALTAQIIETLSNTSAPPANNRYEILPARYDSAFNCPDKQVLDPMKPEDKAKSGLDALSLICQAVLLDHNYNATLPSESPIRSTPPINTQAQVNGIPPTSIYSAIQNKRRILPSANTLSTSSLSNISLTASNSTSLLGSHEDDAASDISDGSERKHDTEGEETDTAPEAEDVKNEDHYGDYVTRCICGFLHDDGYMVECDKCKVWQHVQCVVKNRQVPDEFLCEMCDSTKPVDRQKARLVQQQWIRERQLIEPKIRKEAKPKDTLRNKEPLSDTDSSDGEHIVRNNNVVTKNRTIVGRKKSDSVKVNKKEVKEVVQKRQKRKERKIVKRKTKIQTKQQSHSDDENQDTWSAHLPQLRQWIEKYEEAVTNHYSPELRARISSIRVNGAHVDSSVQYDATVCKCRVHTQPLTEIKYLISTTQLAPNTPVIELRGKYMLSTQHRNSGGSLTTRQHTQRPGPFLFFYRLHKDNTEVCVDTRTYGNSARFIRRSCKPNAELRHCIEKGVLHLYIVSITSVEKNCELTIKHESHDLAAIGTTQIACACGRPDECTVNKTTIKKNGEAPEVARKRRGRRTISSNVPCTEIKSPVREQPPLPSQIETATDSVILPPVPAPAPPALPSPIPEPDLEKVKEEKVDVVEAEEIKVEINELPELSEIKAEVKEEEIKEDPQPVQDVKSPGPLLPPVKIEIKKEKQPKEEKVKSPNSTPISTRRSSHYKSDKEEGHKETESKEKSNKLKKLSREERKLEAIVRAIERMEKADQKKQEHQAKQAHRRESEPGPNPKDEEKMEPKVKRRRRRGRARTTSTNAQTIRSRLDSTDSYITSGDENLLSPNDSLPPNRPSLKDDSNESKAAGLLLALSNGEPDNKEAQKSPSQELDSSSNSAHSSPETPQLSSACLLVQAAVEPLESGFKFPKTKKGLMNEWLNKVPDPVQSISPSSLMPHTNQFISEEVGNCSTNIKTGALMGQASNFCEFTPQQQRGGNAKKRWLRQAISEDHSCDDTVSRPDSPPISEAVAPPKKRKLPRESLSNDNSPPSTPTTSGPAKTIDTPRSSQEGSVEIVYSSAEGDSPSQIMESDADLNERAAKMKQEFGKTVILSTSEQAANKMDSIKAFLDPRLGRDSALFTSSEHLVGTVEKTLSILGFQNAKTEISTPAKRKLSITEYRQRKRLNTDKPDEQDNEHDSHGNDDNNSSESFKDILPKSRSRSSSSSSSFSSCDELPTTDFSKAPAFNSEPTELERQREISSMRLKKAFGLAIDDESRKPPVIDMSSILQCDMESKIKPSSQLSNPSFPSAILYDLSMSPTLRASSGSPDRAYTPVLPPATSFKNSSLTKETDTDDQENYDTCEGNCEEEPKPESPKTIEEHSVDDVEMKSEEEKEHNMFYTPDDDEDRGIPECVEQKTTSYVPPFNNPVYPNSNFASFTSTIDDDSRYQSRNPSPPPDLEAPTFSATL